MIRPLQKNRFRPGNTRQRRTLRIDDAPGRINSEGEDAGITYLAVAHGIVVVGDKLLEESMMVKLLC